MTRVGSRDPAKAVSSAQNRFGRTSRHWVYCWAQLNDLVVHLGSSWDYSKAARGKWEETMLNKDKKEKLTRPFSLTLTWCDGCTLGFREDGVEVGWMLGMELNLLEGFNDGCIDGMVDASVLMRTLITKPIA